MVLQSTGMQKTPRNSCSIKNQAIHVARNPKGITLILMILYMSYMMNMVFI